MYQNSFWDTVKGQQLADILIEYLPTVAKNERVAKNATVQKQTKQYTMVVNLHYAQQKIAEELDSGAKIVHVIPCSTNQINNELFVVFEKEI